MDIRFHPDNSQQVIATVPNPDEHYVLVHKTIPGISRSKISIKADFREAKDAGTYPHEVTLEMKWLGRMAYSLANVGHIYDTDPELSAAFQEVNGTLLGYLSLIEYHNWY